MRRLSPLRTMKWPKGKGQSRLIPKIHSNWVRFEWSAVKALTDQEVPPREHGPVGTEGVEGSAAESW